MAQRPAELTPDASPWHRWGAELRLCRTARRLSLEQLGRRVHATRSYLSKLERGQRPTPQAVALACDEALEMGGALLAAWTKAETAAGAPRGTAVLLAADCVHVSNPLGDVSNAAPAVEIAEWGPESSDDEGIFVPCRLRDGRMVLVTISRRALLGGIGAGALAAAGLSGVADGAVLSGLTRRARADAAGGLTPIEHLQKLRLVLIDNDNLLGPRQVLPTVHKQIKIIDALRRETGGGDRRQLLTLQTQYAEFASWLHQDAGDWPAARYWLDRALQWSNIAGDPEMTCYVMARKSQLAGEVLDLADVVDLADAAHTMAAPGSRLAAVSRTYAAVGHALRGEAAASQRAFDEAGAAAEDFEPDDPSPFGVWLDVPYVQVHRAKGLDALGQHSEAADAFAAAISRLPQDYHRDRGVYLARQAVAQAGAAVPEQAATVGMQALAVAEDTGSGRIMTELARLDTSLQRWKDLSAVTEFRTSLDDLVLHESGA
jgi:transcriptional regulator with XRE-family HTH domain/tetratricopeptide (TPR) repeat protein